NLPHRTRSDGRHRVEEIVKWALQHPAHQGRHGVEETAVSKKAVHQGRPLIKKVPGIAQLFGAGLAEVVFFRSAIDAAAIDKVGLVLSAIFASHYTFLQKDYRFVPQYDPAGKARWRLQQLSPALPRSRYPGDGQVCL